MKFYVSYNQNSKHNYDFIIDDNGEKTVIELTKKTTDGYLHIPEKYQSILNRKLIRIGEFEGLDLYEITIRENRPIKNQSSIKTEKRIQDYLTDDEKALIKEIYERAKNRMNDPLEKAKREYERAKLEYEKALEKAGKVEA